MPQIERALISVSDKTGIVEFAGGLQDLKVEILSTGGTAKLLRDSGIPVVEVGEYTGQPEILDGRLKTLHPRIHGGILAVRSNPQHRKDIAASGIRPIDMVVVNLYPFEQTIAKPDVTLEECIENIDIGGPTMIRAAAKNWQDVTVIVDTGDYGAILDELRRGSGEVSTETNFRLARKVFVTTSRYEGAICNYLSRTQHSAVSGQPGEFPDVFNYQGIRVQDLRYGENPHQRAVFYRDTPSPLAGEGWGEGVADARQLHGKELSFNNIMDLDAAIQVIFEFRDPAAVIIKHTNPCGVATSPSPGLRPAAPSGRQNRPSPPTSGGVSSPARGEGEKASLREIFIAARECDPLSAFGGIIGLNRTVDAETAAEIGKDFYECVVAPSFEPRAFEILKAKKNIRLMEMPPSPRPSPARGEGVYDMKRVSGGLLVQDADRVLEKVQDSKIVTKKKPTGEEWQAMEFAWVVCKHVKSNAIVYASSGPVMATVGIGCGQTSRVDASRFGALKAKHPLRGCAMASDAFFPFRDNVDEAARAGVTAIIQPGGSVKDGEAIEAADENGIAMVFTGVRHFRH